MVRAVKDKISKPFKWTYAYMRAHKVFTRIVVSAVILEAMLGWMYLPGHIKNIFAADDSVDTTVNATVGSPTNVSPAMVFTTDQTGYMFYRDSGGGCVYSKTTNGGATWGGAQPVDAQTDCLKIAVWYDRWTPGDNTGTLIHIITMDSSANDLWYWSLDTGNLDTVAGNGTTNNIDPTQTGTFAATTNYPSITKATDGDLYAGVIDNTDAYVSKCTGTCTTGTNWSEAGSSPFASSLPASGLGDLLILEPLAGGNIMAIRRDNSANVVDSNVYTDGTSTWDASWTTVETGLAEQTSTAYWTIGAVVNKSTNDVYLTYTDDTNTLGTNDDIRTARYSGGSWTQTADVLTNDSRGVTGTTIALDASSGDVYVVYTAQTTAATASTGNVYWKKSTDNMATWGSESSAVNATAGDMQGVYVNYMSADRIYAAWEDSNGGNKIAGKTIADLTPPTYTQASYRLYDNTDGTGGTWWNGSWLQRRRITINNSASSTNLTNFPIRVSLSSSNIDYGKTQNAGEDIRFVDSDDSTALKYEIETWNESGTSELWVKVPQIDAGSTSDYIYMYYNNVGASDGQDKNNVWDSDYAAVWHMHEATGTTLSDSTVNANNATKVSSTSPNPTTGTIDGAQSFNGSTDHATANDANSLDMNDSLTVSAWVNPSSLNSFQEIFSKHAGAGSDPNYGFQLTDANQVALYIDGFNEYDSASTIPANTWSYVTISYKDSAPNAGARIYINGNLDAIRTSGVGALATDSYHLNIGTNPNNENWNGKLDELRLSDSIRSDDWVKAEYLTGTNAMNTYGAEENFAAALTPLAAQNTAAQRLPSGLPFRLRLLLSVANNAVQGGYDSFKLQYAKKVGTCDTGFSGEAYIDVGSGSLQFWDNPTPSDGADAGVGATDPTDGANPVRMQTYEESNNFTSKNKIGVSEDGLWDFALVDTSHSSGEPYCFRVVKSDGSSISAYSVIPELSLPDLNGAMRGGNFFSGQVEQNAAW